MLAKVFKNFLSQEDCDFLNLFALNCIKNNQFENGRVSSGLNKLNTQMVSRFSPELIFPDLALNIRNKIQAKFNLPKGSINTQFHNEGIIINVSFNGAQVVKHKDSVKDGFLALRCNIITSQPDFGGVLHIENRPVNLQVGDLYICLFSEHEHFVSKNESDTPRIVWQFAFDVKKEDLHEYGLS
jgi:hypothetical protein